MKYELTGNRFKDLITLLGLSVEWQGLYAGEVVDIVDMDTDQEPEDTIKLEPDWSTAPEWANYWAVDYSGKARWYKMEPVLIGDTWAAIGANYAYVDKYLHRPIKHWDKKLQKRPNDKPCRADTFGLLAGTTTSTSSDASSSDTTHSGCVAAGAADDTSYQIPEGFYRLAVMCQPEPLSKVRTYNKGKYYREGFALDLVYAPDSISDVIAWRYL